MDVKPIKTDADYHCSAARDSNTDDGANGYRRVKGWMY